MIERPKNAEIVIRNIEIPDLSQVAKIHMDAFPESILTVFGNKVIRKYYEWQMAKPNECYPTGVFLQHQLVGFSFAGVFLDSEIGFLRKNWLLIIETIFSNPVILVNPVLWKKTQNAFQELSRERKYLKQRNMSNSSQYVKKFGILSTAVKPAYQGSGIGKLITENIEIIASGLGFGTIRMSVHPANSKSILLHEKLGYQKIFFENGKWNGVMEKQLFGTKSSMSEILDDHK